MTTTRTRRRSTFLWQALLILLPVAVLAIVGLFSLRQDRHLAEQEARERAQRLADDLAGKIWTALVEPRPPRADSRNDAPDAMSSNPIEFRVSATGDLLFPKPIAPLIPLALDAAVLNAEQLRLWQVARTSEFGDPDGHSALDAYHGFLQTRPPEPFAAIADFSCGPLLLKLADTGAAARQFESTIDRHPGALLESGLPLESLARLKFLETGRQPGTPAPNEMAGLADAWCSNVVHQPTPVTTALLKQAASLELTNSYGQVAARWLQTWSDHEQARRLYDRAASRWWRRDTGVGTITGILTDSQFATLTNRILTTKDAAPAVSRLSWLSDGGVWLALADVQERGERLFQCVPESRVHELISRVIVASKSVPDYFGVGVELAGRSLIAATNLSVWWEGVSGKGGGPARTYGGPLPDSGHEGAALVLLAGSRKAEEGTDLLKLNVYLTSPATLFSRQRDRTLWFALLIVISAATAVTGLVVAWRAFDRQQRLNEMKSNFVSSVSHELRAPIASVRLMAESLDRGKIPDAQKQAGYFKLIVQECRRLTSLIENVLDFSRIEQGSRRYEFEPTDLAILVQQTLTLMESYAAERHVALAFEQPAEPVVIEADGKAVQQALINLLDNAIKHSPEGATVECGLETLPNCQPPAARMFVRDHGPGIPVAERTRIFEPFYRCGSELRRETQGVGIGLTIVKHIVEAHHGRVAVESEPGKGSCFSIELPSNQSRVNRDSGRI